MRAAIDEMMGNDATFIASSEDEQNLTRIIVDKIGYALQDVIENAPIEKLDNSLFDTLSQTEEAGFSIDATNNVAQLKLPADLLRIIVARLSSWSQSPIPENDNSQVYLMQQDPYARGSWDRPVSILTNHGKDRYLEMYSAKTASDTLNFSFVRKPQMPTIDVTSAESMNTTITVPSMLEEALIYQVAGLTMVAFKDDSASMFFAIANKNLGIETPEQ